MAATYGLFVSNTNQNVLGAKPDKLSFGADFNMYKIKQETRSQIGETLAFDHSLNYFPFFLAYNRNTSLTNGKALAISTGSFVNVWSGEVTSHGYMFVAFNPGVQ